MSRYHTIVTKMREIDIWGLGFGVLGLILWVWISSYSIVTTKSLMMHGTGAGVMVKWTTTWDMFMTLIQGGYSLYESISTAFAFFLFVLYIASTSGTEDFIANLEKRGKGLGGLFISGMVILLVLDWYANYQYLQAFPAVYQWIVSLGISFVILFLGHWSIHKIMEALFEEE